VKLSSPGAGDRRYKGLRGGGGVGGNENRVKVDPLKIFKDSVCPPMQHTTMNSRKAQKKRVPEDASTGT